MIESEDELIGELAARALSIDPMLGSRELIESAVRELSGFPVFSTIVDLTALLKRVVQDWKICPSIEFLVEMKLNGRAGRALFTAARELADEMRDRKEYPPPGVSSTLMSVGRLAQALERAF